MTDRDFGGALDARRQHNAAIEARILADRIRTEHMLRCILQGCLYREVGGPCQFCGTPLPAVAPIEGRSIIASLRERPTDA